MEKIILYVDDVTYASEQFAELAPDAHSVVARHWVLVACAPRMTHRISKWVSHSARENWRAKWFSKVQAQMLPLLERNGGQVTPVLAKGPLAELTAQLKREHAAVHVVDARRPKIGVDMEPVTPDQKPAHQSGWAFPGAVMGMGALLVMANELAE